MLICNLDDSGTHENCPVITMAGYAGFLPHWNDFEKAAEQIYSNYSIDVFHASAFHATDKPFEGWRRIKKQTYAKEIYDAGRDTRALDMGVAFAVRKDMFNQRKSETGLAANMSPYGFCFNAILGKLLADPVFNELLGRNGVDLTVVVEAGNKNDEDIRRIFNNVRTMYGLERKLKSLEFKPKGSSRALQLADFFAFYHRRHVEATERTGSIPDENFYIQQMRDHIYVVEEVAIDFHGTRPPGA